MVHFTYLQSFQVDCLPKREIFDSTATECEAVDIAFPETVIVAMYTGYSFFLSICVENPCYQSVVSIQTCAIVTNSGYALSQFKIV